MVHPSFSEHAARLIRACRQRAFPIEESAVLASRELFKTEARSGFARLYVTAGDGGPTDAIDQPRLFVLLEVAPLPIQRRRGL